MVAGGERGCSEARIAPMHRRRRKEKKARTCVDAAFRPPAHGQHRWRERVGVFLQKTLSLEKGKGSVARLDARVEDALNVDRCPAELACIEVNLKAKCPTRCSHEFLVRSVLNFFEGEPHVLGHFFTSGDGCRNKE